MWYKPESWLVREPGYGADNRGHAFVDTFADGRELATFRKDFGTRYLEVEDEVFAAPNHTVLVTRWKDADGEELLLTVERAVLDWPAFEKRWIIKEGENWLDHLPSWIRRYFEKG